jgi:hypothetical protein
MRDADLHGILECRLLRGQFAKRFTAVGHLAAWLPALGNGAGPTALNWFADCQRDRGQCAAILWISP